MVVFPGMEFSLDIHSAIIAPPTIAAGNHCPRSFIAAASALHWGTHESSIPLSQGAKNAS